jgi:hypothetical protein
MPGAKKVALVILVTTGGSLSREKDLTDTVRNRIQTSLLKFIPNLLLVPNF